MIWLKQFFSFAKSPFFISLFPLFIESSMGELNTLNLIKWEPSHFDIKIIIYIIRKPLSLFTQAL